jgi:hypothetical protein
MATHPQYRLYALLATTPSLIEIYSRNDLDELTDYTRTLLGKAPYNQSPTERLLKVLRVVDAPSMRWTPAFVGDDKGPETDFDELIVVYEFNDPRLPQAFIDLMEAGKKQASDAPIREVGVDLGVGSADHWCPDGARLAMFGDRTDARRTVDADALTDRALIGQNVNVVIIDQGLDQTSIPTWNWGGGLNWDGPPPDTVLVGTAKRISHGMMIARSILDLAPGAVLYDVPLIPERIGLIPPFLSSADAAYKAILKRIKELRSTPPWTGPWVLVNAWAIFNRATETPLGNYTENKQSGGHPLIKKIRNSVRKDRFDVVFAAGNCGEFCPSRRCGGLDRGPGHSIWGANALKRVITAGAVRTDDTWAGYSSQGPGPDKNWLGKFKPDLCAPSDFHETNDAAVRNSGTSAACAVTAGVVAALRSNPEWYQSLVTPRKLRRALIDSARKTQGSGWNGRLGHGVLDAGAAITLLPP